MQNFSANSYRGRISEIRGGAISGSDSGTDYGEPEAKKRAFDVSPYRHYSSVDKELILSTVERIHKMTGYPVRFILKQMGISSSTYYP
ncbi:hypothetical protein GF312_00105 [Candidatus Poribacteria bacterium]|nr:hypothetical protein [Candidatus Poribacteria bacterium]